MDSRDFFWIPTSFFGIIAGLAGIRTVHEYKKRKHAKQLYDFTKKSGLVSVSKAINTSFNELPKIACIEGIIDYPSKNHPAMSIKYEHCMSFFMHARRFYPLKRFYETFNLRGEDGSEIQVMPGMETVMEGLNRKKEKQYGWLKTLALSLLRFEFVLGTTEYYVNDSDLLTVFGILRYNENQRKYILDAECISTNGVNGVLSHLKDEKSMSNVIGYSILFTISSLLAALFGYRFYQHIFHNGNIDEFN